MSAREEHESLARRLFQRDDLEATSEAGAILEAYRGYERLSLVKERIAAARRKLGVEKWPCNLSKQARLPGLSAPSAVERLRAIEDSHHSVPCGKLRSSS